MKAWESAFEFPLGNGCIRDRKIERLDACYIVEIRRMKQNTRRSTEGCSKLKRSVDLTSSGKNGLNIRTNAETRQVQERLISSLENMQVPNLTGQCVRRSKRPLLASRTRCNVLWKPPIFGNKVKIGNQVQFGNKFANWYNVWSIEGVIVYGHVPECHVTFGRGRLHNVWWDLHIEHKTSWGTISNVPWHIPSEELRWKSRRP